MIRIAKVIRHRVNFRTLSSTLPSYASDPLESKLQKIETTSTETRPNYDFKTHFYYTKKDPSLFSGAQEGAYVDISQDDITKFFPEGMAGDAKAEFECSQRSSWMIRDTSKLLCRLLDEFRPSTGKSISNKQTVQTPINVPELTDRPEWDKAQIRVLRYGAELPRAAPYTEVGLRITDGPGSVVDTYMNQVKDGRYPYPNKIMLTGARGVGKSIALNQLIQYARSTKEWLVLFVPKGWEHVQGGAYVEPIESSFLGGTVFDNRLMSVDLLRGFWRAHKNDLAAIRFKNQEGLKKYEEYIAIFAEKYYRELTMPGTKIDFSPRRFLYKVDDLMVSIGKEKLSFLQMRAIVEGEDVQPAEDPKDADVLKGYEFKRNTVVTLEELVKLGVAFRELAGLIVIDLIQELEALESKKVLIVVDEFNAWGGKSAYEYDFIPVQGRDIVVPRALGYLHKKKAEAELRTIKNGMFVCAESLSHPEGLKDIFKAASNSVPLTIQVPHYSQVEYLAAMLFYTHQMCVHEGTSTQDLLAYRMLVNSNPRLTRMESITFFMRLAMAEVKGDYMMLEGDEELAETEDEHNADDDGFGYDKDD